MLRAVILICACALAAPAYADEKSDAEVLFRSGERAFNATQYAAAAEAFEQAYAKLPLPAIAFSTAQAHRLQYFVDNQPQHLERAVLLYHAYVEAQKQGGRVSDAVANLAVIEPMLKQLQANGGLKAAPPPTKKTRLMVTADVENARATIDGEAGPTPLVKEVAPGEHAVTIEADGYESYSVKTQAVADEMVPVEGKLVAKPAHLVVHAPASAHVAIDGRAGPAMDKLDITAGKHLVAIAATGRVPYAREVDVARGSTTTIDAQMPLTTQREVARWVLVGSGVLALGTGATALATLSADHDATKLRDALDTGGQPADAIARYDQARDTRDARLTATEVLGGATLAVAATGVLLYLFDNPTSEGIAPALGARSAGVSFSGRF